MNLVTVEENPHEGPTAFLHANRVEVALAHGCVASMRDDGQG